MEIRIIQIGTQPAIRLAAEELRKYLPKIDPCVETAILFSENNIESLRGIKIGLLLQEDSALQVPDSCR